MRTERRSQRARAAPPGEATWAWILPRVKCSRGRRGRCEEHDREVERVRHNSAGKVSTTASADGVSKASSRTPSRIPDEVTTRACGGYRSTISRMAVAFAGGVPRHEVLGHQARARGRRATTGPARIAWTRTVR